MVEKEEHLFERLARERNITVEEMRAIISARIEKGWNNPDLEKRAQWRKIPCAGDIPTPDEWLRYAVERLEADGRKDLLRWQMCIRDRISTPGAIVSCLPWAMTLCNVQTAKKKCSFLSCTINMNGFLWKNYIKRQ